MRKDKSTVPFKFKPSSSLSSSSSSSIAPAPASRAVRVDYRTVSQRLQRHSVELLRRTQSTVVSTSTQSRKQRSAPFERTISSGGSGHTLKRRGRQSERHLPQLHVPFFDGYDTDQEVEYVRGYRGGRDKAKDKGKGKGRGRGRGSGNDSGGGRSSVQGEIDRDIDSLSLPRPQLPTQAPSAVNLQRPNLAYLGPARFNRGVDRFLAEGNLARRQRVRVRMGESTGFEEPHTVISDGGGELTDGIAQTAATASDGSGNFPFGPTPVFLCSRDEALFMVRSPAFTCIH